MWKQCAERHSAVPLTGDSARDRGCTRTCSVTPWAPLAEGPLRTNSQNIVINWATYVLCFRLASYAPHVTAVTFTFALVDNGHSKAHELARARVRNALLKQRTRVVGERACADADAADARHHIGRVRAQRLARALRGAVLRGAAGGLTQWLQVIAHRVDRAVSRAVVLHQLAIL